MKSFEAIKERALNGIGVSLDEALYLAENFNTDTLCRVADEIRLRHCGNRVDTCSIANARSGRCSEDCKWCAQSRFFSTGIDEYEYIPTHEAVAIASQSRKVGVGRFSLVTSGRRVTTEQVGRFCNIFKMVGEKTGMSLCASMGLVGKDVLQELKDAGVKRYHCNLETGSEYFATLCTTHSHADKLATIRAAREVGMEVCCGGIIGMGETLRQRLQLAVEARDAGAVSIPINILQPIPGTALEHTPLISEEEVVQCVALYRFIAPTLTLRFAGGRARLSPDTTARILRGGMNGAMIGDLLTTIGADTHSDIELFRRCGYES